MLMQALMDQDTGGFSPVTNTYTGSSGTENAPAGATSCFIEGWGYGGAGQQGSPSPGTGGGGGGYFARTVSLSGGESFSYVAAVHTSGNATTVSSASPVVSMTANFGNAGGSALGGTASGGTTNTTGTSGSSPTGGASPNGGANQSTPGANGNLPGGGGAGSVTPATQGAGADGRVRFAYT